jgi:hypothetical protein
MSHYIPSNLLYQRDFALEMMKNQVRFWDFIEVRDVLEFQNDKEFILQAMKFSGYILNMVPKNYQSKEFLIECCENQSNPESIRYFNLDIFDYESLEKILKIDSRYIIGVDFLILNEKWILFAFSNVRNGVQDARFIFQNLPMKFKQDKSMEWKSMSYFKWIFDLSVFDLFFEFV